MACDHLAYRRQRIPQIVELNARSGEVLRIAKNGTLPNEYIPYLERI